MGSRTEDRVRRAYLTAPLALSGVRFALELWDPDPPAPPPSDPGVVEGRPAEGAQELAEEPAAQSRALQKEERSKLYAQVLRDAEGRFLKKAGRGSMDELLADLDELEKTRQTKTTKAAEEAEAETLRKELDATRGKVKQLEPQAQRLTTLMERMRTSEIEAAARRAGVRDQAVAHVAAIVSNRVKWDAAGEMLRVDMPGASGEMVPIGTLDELMSELRETAAYLFRPSQEGGSGTNIGGPPAVPGAGKQPKRARKPSVAELATGQWDPNRE